MEAVIIIAAIAQRFHLAPLPGSANGAKSVAFTLRPNGPLRVKLLPRNPRATSKAKSRSAKRHSCNAYKRLNRLPLLG